MKRTEQPNNRHNTPMSNDERIVDRTNQRRKKIKRKKMIIRGALGSVLLVIGVLLAILLFFNINKISVTGDTMYSAEEIIAASEVENGDNLVFLSNKKLNELITKKLPYVGEVKIKRKLPAHLEIQIIKTDACFAVQQGDKYTLLNSSGKVLELNREELDKNLILLNAGKITTANLGEIAVFENENLFVRAQEVYETCKKIELIDITAMDVMDLHNIKMEYQGRIAIVMGNTDGDKLKNKLELGKEAIDRQNQEDSLFRGTLDLKIDKRASLTPEKTEEEIEKEDEVVETVPQPETTPETTPETQNPSTDVNNEGDSNSNANAA